MISQYSFFNELDEKFGDLNSTTFIDNMKLPIHRWYRYTAGFSAAWVGSLIEKEKKYGRINVLDPFSGSGTVPLESLFLNVNAFGLESHPYAYKISKCKLNFNSLVSSDFRSFSKLFLDEAKANDSSPDDFPQLICRCFPGQTLKELNSLKQTWANMKAGYLKDMMWFVITAILRSVSPVGTAQWQYILPNKSKSRVLMPYEAFSKKIEEICNDISLLQPCKKTSQILLLNQDAREEENEIPDTWADLVITSPPYANNYDYADAMRLEMLFWGDISNWSGLKTISSKLVRACTQHVGGLKKEVSDLLNDPLLSPIQDELLEKFELLATERESHGGKKNYHFMVVAYFYDMAKVFQMLARKTASNCKMCFVIGDSAPYGVYIPVDDWLGKLALNSGFSSYHFEKLRDRNNKWKNRKHKVPLKEGRLWILK